MPPDDKTEIREICDRIAAIAPLPESGEVSAPAMAKRLLVGAQRRWTRLTAFPPEDISPDAVDAMCAQFAAATALLALADTGSPELDLGVSPPLVPEVLQGMSPAEVATFIRDTTGESVGEFLYEFLGAETADEVSHLAGLLMAVTPPKPRVVCLCGSTRFMDAFHAAGWAETLAGRIVLSVGVAKHVETADGGHAAEALGEGVAEALDELHKRKIDLADEILVLNVGGYIGDSTRSEIDYAREHGKAIRFLEPVAATELAARLVAPALLAEAKAAEAVSGNG